MKKHHQIRHVNPIPGLGLEVVANNEIMTFSFVGEKDAVRLATRDLIYGLGMEPEVVHSSEIAIMNGEMKPDNNARIDLTFKTSDYQQLVFVFRYLSMLDFSLSKIARDSVYLRTIKNEAESSSGTMFLTPYYLSFTHCLWLEDELKKESEKQLSENRQPAIETGFFSNAKSSTNDPYHPESRITTLFNTKNNVIIKIAAMISRNPLNKNPIYQSKNMAVNTLNNYCHIKNTLPAYDIQTDIEGVFALIRPDDRAEFKLLAETYKIASEQLQELEQPKRETESCTCTIL